jgi:hypothetical protein
MNVTKYYELHKNGNWRFMKVISGGVDRRRGTIEVVSSMLLLTFSLLNTLFIN